MTDGNPQTFQPSATLRSRTYIGLILSQFLAAFNDQAIHIVAIFYAGDMIVRFAPLRIGQWTADEKAVISVVTACFISPFFFFSTLAGILADKYSKRATLVFWKVAEVVMMAVALLGFLLPHLANTTWGRDLARPETLATWSALVVVSVVFLMGTHSAFFVPAKYGVMPEILQPIVLSRGNGFLEGTSFVAQIMGTAGGGYLYYGLKSEIALQPNGNVLIPGREWVIGLLLLLLAIIGAGASLLIARMPAAAPDRRLTWMLWRPLAANCRVLIRSRPLALAVLGIAFFTFITLFARQTLLYDGETNKELESARLREDRRESPQADEDDSLLGMNQHVPGEASETQRAELRVALLIALIGLGIGIGSPLAGHLSGNKVELGLVPLGAVFLILFTGSMAYFIRWMPTTVFCLVCVGIAASFYIVPLYTLLQHRAPKESKGNMVATSNFINVAGGLIAVAVFWAVTAVVEKLLGLSPGRRSIEQLEMQLLIPKILFVVLSVMIAGMLLLLCRKLPDFFVRSLLWLRSHGRYRLKVVGLHNMPSEGSVVLATNCDRFDTCMHVVTATDRFTRFLLLEKESEEPPPWILRYLARRTGLLALPSGDASTQDWGHAEGRARRTVREGHLLGVTADGQHESKEMAQLLAKLQKEEGVPVVPVFCGPLSGPLPAGEDQRRVRRVQVVIGHPLPANSEMVEVRQAIRILGEWLRQVDQDGTAALTSAIPKA